MGDVQALSEEKSGPMTTRFADRLNRFLGRVTHKCAETDEDYGHVFSTRYTAYRRQDIIGERKDGWLFDHDFDFTENSFLTMTLIDDKFASTFRIHVASKLSDPLPSRGVFEDLIDPHLAAGLTVVDPTRLAARFDDARTFPELPFIALRPAWLAAEHFDADVVLATVASEHTAFYQRVFGYRTLCEPRDYPKVRFKIVCMALDFPAVKRAVETRYPFFRSTRSERDALFGGRKKEHAWEAGQERPQSIVGANRGAELAPVRAQ